MTIDELFDLKNLLEKSKTEQGEFLMAMYVNMTREPALVTLEGDDQAFMVFLMRAFDNRGKVIDKESEAKLIHFILSAATLLCLYDKRSKKKLTNSLKGLTKLKQRLK